MNDPGASIITVDGPSGSGKGTVCRRIAAWLGWHYLDSGALYRVLAHAARSNGVSLDNEDSVAELARNLDVRFVESTDETRIFLDGRDISDAVRTESTAEAASIVASQPLARKALLALQRSFARPPGLVADGRDMGTVVFPAARYKLFLTASPEERAERRYKQLRDKGINVSLPALSEEIEQRDVRDKNREIAPTRAAEDAELIDSTGIDADAVVRAVQSWLNAQGLAPRK